LYSFVVEIPVPSDQLPATAAEIKLALGTFGAFDRGKSSHFKGYPLVIQHSELENGHLP
jgi:hypothetical protein